MSGSDDDNPTTQELRVQQSAREVEERAHAQRASSEPEQLAAERRADKAAYLEGKLAEQAESEDA